MHGWYSGSCQDLNGELFLFRKDPIREALRMISDDPELSLVRNGESCIDFTFHTPSRIFFLFLLVLIAINVTIEVTELQDQVSRFLEELYSLQVYHLDVRHQHEYAIINDSTPTSTPIFDFAFKNLNA